MGKFRLICGNAFRELNRLEPQSVDCVFTSPNPPFYSKEGLGSEETEEEYVYALTVLASKVKTVLKDSGTFWLHLADYYDKNGSLRVTPANVAISIKNSGWLLRSDLIWHRTNEPIQEDKTRFKRDAEHIFFFTKSLDHYFYPLWCDSSVFSFEYREPRHGKFESGFPEDLIKICIVSGSPVNGIILDPFAGTGTTGLVALQNDRSFIGIEIKPELITKIKKRLDSAG